MSVWPPSLVLYVKIFLRLMHKNFIDTTKQNFIVLLGGINKNSEKITGITYDFRDFFCSPVGIKQILFGKRRIEEC